MTDLLTQTRSLMENLNGWTILVQHIKVCLILYHIQCKIHWCKSAITGDISSLAHGAHQNISSTTDNCRLNLWSPSLGHEITFWPALSKTYSSLI